MKKIKEEDLIADLQRVDRELNRKELSEEEYKEKGGKYGISTFERKFGSWNKAKEAAGLTPVRRKEYTREELFSKLDEYYEKRGHGKKITVNDFYRVTGVSDGPVYDKFDKSFPKFIEAYEKEWKGCSEGKAQPSKESVKPIVEEKEIISIFPLDINKIIESLRENQYKSESPTDFEESIADAFDFLGFLVKEKGGKADTNVLLTAKIGQLEYKVISDGKTTKSDKINDKQIDWDSLDDHKKKYNADFVVVVGPDFAGGNLEKRAEKYDVWLLKTEDLIKLIESHQKLPLALVELKDLFAGKGDRSAQLKDLLTQIIQEESY